MPPNLKIHYGSLEQVHGGGNTERLAGEVTTPGSMSLLSATLLPPLPSLPFFSAPSLCKFHIFHVYLSIGSGPILS